MPLPVTISSPPQLAQWLATQQHAMWLALDTEFVSERRYLPELCLVQVATSDSLVMIDPLTAGDLVPFWRFICDSCREVIVHAARSEMEFCYRAVGELPQRIVDVQLAAGFVETDYPASFGTLVERSLGVTIGKGETRTDWSRRPFTPQQIDYALDDVRYLPPLAEKIRQRLHKRQRLSWFAEEAAAARESLWETFSGETWRGVARSGSLPPRGLATVRALWTWRDQWGRQVNRPAQHILRDDLIVELAKQAAFSPRGITTKYVASLRGMPPQQNIIADITEAICRAIALDDADLPAQRRSVSCPHYPAATSFLQTVLAMVCQREHIAPMIVATTHDIREWLAQQAGELPAGVTPRLSSGWRHDLLTPLLDDILHGRCALRLSPRAPHHDMLEVLNLAREQFDLG